MSDANPYALVRGPIDLTTCDLEPVHRIGAVQNHGALLLFEKTGGRLLEASANWREHLPSTEGSTTLRQLFGDFASRLEAVEIRDRATLLGQGPWEETEISAHRVADRLVVEVESTRTARAFDPVAALNTVMHALGRAQSSREHLRTLATELRAALGIDHVMIYRFLPDWVGEVVAESTEHPPEYLGLRFPATDIPEPAREVFRKVWVRHIADVGAAPVSILGSSGEISGADLTQVGLRAASPIHLEYLDNMKVRASLTLSLRMGDNLWGLVACHHRSPYLLSPSARASLEILAQVASLQLSSLLQGETSEERRDCEARLAELEASLELSDEAQLAHHVEELQGLLESDMVAVYENQRWTRKAGVSLPALERFLDWLRDENDRGSALFHRNDLPDGLVPGYAGVLVVASADSGGRLVCWFRREQSHSVRWAGNPQKSDGTTTGRLNPRASFVEYVELTRGKALPWTEIDLWRASRFSDVLRAISLRLHRRLEQRNEALARSNRELDSFAYMASHDLKEPLRGIHNYATFLREDFADRLDGEGLMFLQGLTDLSRRMSVMVDALLAYSRLNSQKLEFQDCDMEALARDTCDLLRVTRGARVTIIPPLPVVQAYPPFLSEILINLLTNAIKYSDEPNRKIEIGGRDEDPEYDIFFVRDNGIGIPPEYHETIFELFRRLHGEGERGDGSGVGLTIVKKMVERHAGRVWVESAPGGGTTIFVALPRLAKRMREEPASERSAGQPTRA